MEEFLKFHLLTPRTDFLLSSTDSSDEENSYEELDRTKCLLSASGLLIPESHPKQQDYFSVIDHYSDRDFWRNFRVTRSTFSLIISKMKDSGFRQNVKYSGGFLPMTIEEVTYITLQYLGNQGAMRLIAEKMGRAESAVWTAIDQVTTFLFECQNDFILWPENDAIEEIATTFKSRAGFPGVIGAVDGTHVPIHAPIADQKSYLNYKRFHSIVLMAVALPDKSFSYIFTGFPGSNHDSYVFSRSSLFERLESSTNPLFNYEKYHILGDGAFQIKPWMLVPYKKAAHAGLTPSQKKYNNKHSTTRTVVEQAFGDLFNRFRRCCDIDADIEKAVKIVTASCVLHNLCIQNGDFCLENDLGVADRCNVNPPATNVDSRNVCGVAKRERIRIQLSRNQ